MPSPARFRSTLAAVVDQPEELRELRLFHKALADVNRLRIVRRLSSGPASVTELIEEVGLSQPLVSWHLGRLRGAGIVETRRAGRETICRIRPGVWHEFAAREAALLRLPLDGQSPGGDVLARTDGTAGAEAALGADGSAAGPLALEPASEHP